MADQSPFANTRAAAELEEGVALTPKFDADGLVTCVATDAASGDVLMVAHMNAQALAKTIATGEAWYFSRSRRALWKKGETSGHTQRVVEEGQAGRAPLLEPLEVKQRAQRRVGVVHAAQQGPEPGDGSASAADGPAVIVQWS